MKTSIIIAFYNKMDYLRFVIAGLERQSIKEFEVIIADDGSKPEVVKEISRIRIKSSLSIKHIWHEDLGWRKNIILNKAVRESKSDYLIFMDADCIPHKNFVKEHLREAEKNIILSGRRVNLSEEITNSLSTEKVRNGFLDKHAIKWLIKGIRKEFTHAEKGLYLPFLRFFLTMKNKEILGSNFSLFKDVLVKINGFDERYLGPAIGEDTDIEYRASLAGIKLKSLRNLAVQYHLYHLELSRKNDNYKIFNETRKNQMSHTPYGINKKNEDN